MDRPRDVVWDTLEELFGETRTPLEHGRRNLAVRELRAADATPDEIRVAFRYCQESFTTFTEIALAKHFSRAQHVAAQPNEQAAKLSLIRKMAGLDE